MSELHGEGFVINKATSSSYIGLSVYDPNIKCLHKIQALDLCKLYCKTIYIYCLLYLMFLKHVFFYLIGPMPIHSLSCDVRQLCVCAIAETPPPGGLETSG